MYEDETVFEKCTVEQIVTLFEYTAEERKADETQRVENIQTILEYFTYSRSNLR